MRIKVLCEDKKTASINEAVFHIMGVLFMERQEGLFPCSVSTPFTYRFFPDGAATPCGRA